jgi:Cu/Ag efflux pump CusA
MPLDDALVLAGSTRLRPILMTTLTTIIAMVPMALAYGKNGEIMKPLGLVDIGGLAISTLMALFILPGFYKLMYKEGSIYDEMKQQAPKVARQIDAENLQKEINRDNMAVNNEV